MRQSPWWRLDRAYPFAQPFCDGDDTIRQFMAEEFDDSIGRLHGACTYLSLRHRPVKERLRLATAGLSLVHPEDMPNAELMRRWYLVWFTLTQQPPSEAMPEPVSAIDAMPESLAERIEAEILSICRDWTDAVSSSRTA